MSDREYFLIDQIDLYKQQILQFEDYYDGLKFKEWKEQYSDLLFKLGIVDDQEAQSLYSKIQKCDWRHGSCGGCI